MARIEPPSAREIAAELNLSAATLGKTDDSEVLKSINQALPNVVRRVNEAIDQASAPYDFPFTEEMLREAFPTKSDTEIAEKLDGQNASVQEWMKFDVVMQFLGRLTGRSAPGSVNPYKDRYQFAKELRDENRDLTLNLIAYVVSQSPDGQASAEEEVATATDKIPVSMSVRVRRTW